MERVSGIGGWGLAVALRSGRLSSLGVSGAVSFADSWTRVCVPGSGPMDMDEQWVSVQLATETDLPLDVMAQALASCPSCAGADRRGAAGADLDAGQT